MNPAYYLVATGGVATPKINHGIFANPNDDAEACREAESVVSALAKAGYFQFTLWAREGEKEAQIATYHVELRQPLVTPRYAFGKEPAEAKPRTLADRSRSNDKRNEPAIRASQWDQPE